jgi:Tol biopolymer transport system component
LDLLLIDFAHPERPRVIAPNVGTASQQWVPTSHYRPSPDGQRLAYCVDDAIYTMAADGSGPKKVIGSVPDARSVSWSPDGRWLLFSSIRDGPTSVYEVALDGTGLRLVVPPLPGWCQSVAFYSPDGREIGFNRWCPDGTGTWPQSKAWVVGRDGSTLRAVGPPGSHAGMWSSDGSTRILLKLDQDGSGGTPWLMNADGSNVRPVGGSDGQTWLTRVGRGCWWNCFTAPLR